MSRILVTGASGCVGQYVSRWLLENSDAELLLWLRDPAKLSAVPSDHPRVRLLVGDLRETDRFIADLATVNRVIHTATAWGDPDRAHQVNVVAVKRMLQLLNPAVVEQIIYFSTASILDRHLRPLPEALAYGTEYIQTKAQCLKDLEQHPLADKIIAVSQHWFLAVVWMEPARSPRATSPKALPRQADGCGWRDGYGPTPASTSSTRRTSPGSAVSWLHNPMSPTGNLVKAPCDGS